MVFEKKMSVKDLIEQMREELKHEQEEAAMLRKPAKKAKHLAKAKKKPAKHKTKTKPKKKKRR